MIPRTLPLLLLAGLAGWTSAGCTASASPPSPPETYAVGGTVSGLTMPGLVLQLDGADDLTVDADGAFAFPRELESGEGYDVTVLTAPGGLTCTVSAGDGVVAGADVTSVRVTCSAAAFTVGGTVAGLVDGTLALGLNGDQQVMVAGDGPFTFPTAVADGTPYEVTVTGLPAHTTCTLANATGVVVGANVTDVQAACVRSFEVRGRVFGATAPVTLRLNGAGDLVVPAGSAVPFAFGTRVANGAPYSVTVSVPPEGQTCTVLDGAGTVAGADVGGVEVVCASTAAGLLASDNAPAAVYRSVSTADATNVALSRNIAFDHVAGLAYDEAGGMLYGLDDASDRLVAIHPVTGAAAAIGFVGIADVTGLAFDGQGSVLYGIASAAMSTSGQLVRINPASGAGTPVGAGFMTGGGRCLGLAYDEAGGVLYASTDAGIVHTLDPATGGSTGSLNTGMVVAIDGLAFDQAGGALYGLVDGETLVRIDTTTGTPTTVGAVAGFSGLGGLAYAGDFADLFATDVSRTGVSTLLSLDPASASARSVGSTGWPLAGLAHDPGAGVAWGITPDAHLLRMDPNTGETSYVGQVAVPGGHATRCLAFNPDTGTLFTFGAVPAADDVLLEVGTDGMLVSDHGTVAADGGDWTALCFAIAGADRRLFGIHDPRPALPDARLYQIQATGGPGVLVHTLAGLAEVQALAYEHDSDPGRFLAIDTASDRLVQVDRLSGAVTAIGPTPRCFGLIWIP